MTFKQGTLPSEPLLWTKRFSWKLTSSAEPQWKLQATVLRVKNEELGKTQVISLGQKALHLGAPMPTWIKFLKNCLQPNTPLHLKPCPDFRSKRPCSSVPPPPSPQTPVKMVRSHFLMENEDQWPTVKSHPTSFHLTHHWKGLWRRTLHAGLPLHSRWLCYWGQIHLGREQKCLGRPQSDSSASFLSLGAALRSLTYQPGHEDRNLVIYTLHPPKPRRQRYAPSPQLPESMCGSKFFPLSQGRGEGWGGEERKENFPGGPVDKSPSSNARDMGLIPGWGTKIPHAMRQLSPCPTTKTQGGQKKKKKSSVGMN